MIVTPSRELLQTRLVLLQRYLDNILAHRPLYTDPSFWLFVESEKFPEMVGEFRLLERGPESMPKTRILRDSPRYPDSVLSSLPIPSYMAIVGGSIGLFDEDYKSFGNFEKRPIRVLCISNE